MKSSILATILAGIFSVFGANHPTISLPPSVPTQAAVAAAAVPTSDQPSPAPVVDAPTPQPTQPLVSNAPGIAQFASLQNQFAAAVNVLGGTLSLLRVQSTSTAPNVQSQLDALQLEIAQTNRISNLSNVTITSPTFSGVSTSNIPEGGNLYYTDARVESVLAASTTIGTTFGANTWTALNLFSGGASTTNLSNFGTAYFGGSATSSFSSTGALTLVSNGLTVGTNQLTVSSGNVGIGTTSPSSALSVTGSGYLSNNLTLGNLGFYTDQGAGATVGRFPNRLFVGSAADTNAALSLSGLPSWLAASYVVRDAQLAAVSRNGLIGISASTRSSDYTGGLQQATIGVASYAVNDRSGATARPFYGEIQTEPSSLYSSIFEGVAKDKSGVDNTRTPYGGTNAGQGTYGFSVSCGGDPSYGGTATNNCNTGFVFQSDGTHNWNKGIVFTDNALTGANGAPGGGSAATAIEMGYGQGIRWYSSNGSVVGGAIRSLTTSSANQSHEIDFKNNEVAFANSNSSNSFDISHVASGVNFLRVTDAIAGSAPMLSASTTGSDTNIDVQLNPVGAGTVRTANSFTAPQFIVSGNVSSAAWTTGGVGFTIPTATYTDTSSSGTVGSTYVHNIAAPTLATNNPVTYTNAYTLDIAGPPTAGSNVTIGTAGALRVGAGQAQFNGLISGGGGATLVGGTVNLNTSNNFVTNINTGTSNANVNIGGGSNTVAIGSPVTLFAGTASKAPLSFALGTNLTTPAAGSVEYDGTQLYFTPSSAARNSLAQVLGSAALTQGSVPFVTTNGNFTQNNANFFWDNTNSRLGIGTSSPLTRLHVEAPNATINTAALGQTTLTLQTNSAQAADAGASIGLGGLTDSTGVQRNFGIIAARKANGTNANTSGYLSFYTNLTGVGIGERMRIDPSGNIGVASTTPWRTLSVTGTVGFDGLTGAIGAGSLCLTANKEVVYNSGSDNCLSSIRSTKHDITPLAVDAVSQLAALQPVSFVYNDDASSTVRYGFIAEDTASVDSHLATYNQAGAISGVDDRAVLSIIVKALQDLIKRVGDFADSFTTKELTFTRATGDELDVKKLCVGSTCVTEDQLKAMLAAAGSSGGSSGSGSSSSSSASDTTPPVIEINGKNPAQVNVGDTYTDLGATITGPQADLNLGIKTFLNGTLTSNIVIDTSSVATDTIDYVVTDANGLTSTSSRTVIIQAATSSPSAQ